MGSGRHYQTKKPTNIAVKSSNSRKVETLTVLVHLLNTIKITSNAASKINPKPVKNQVSLCPSLLSFLLSESDGDPLVPPASP